jgi:hypothetical protein
MVARISRREGEWSNPKPDFSGNTVATGISDSETIGILFNYGCHPTSLGPGNMHISPDYIGAAREILEAQYGGTALFLQGASGDTGPMIS